MRKNKGRPLPHQSSRWSEQTLYASFPRQTHSVYTKNKSGRFVQLVDQTTVSLSLSQHLLLFQFCLLPAYFSLSILFIVFEVFQQYDDSFHAVILLNIEMCSTLHGSEHTVNKQ